MHNPQCTPVLKFKLESLQHMKVMEDMLKDFLLGEHLLLVGNQVRYIILLSNGK